MVANQTSGRAIADVRGVYFYNSLADIASQTAFQTLLADTTNWYAALTLRGTVNASQDAPSVTPIHVDQFDPSIGITAEPGNFTFEAFLPAMTKDAIAKWLEGDAVTAKGLNFKSSSSETASRHGYGYNLDGKLYDRMVLIETRTGDFFLFSRAQLSFSFGQEDKTYGFRVNGEILAPSSDTQAHNKMLYAFTNTGELASSQVMTSVA